MSDCPTSIGRSAAPKAKIIRRTRRVTAEPINRLHMWLIAEPHTFKSCIGADGRVSPIPVPKGRLKPTKATRPQLAASKFPMKAITEYLSEQVKAILGSGQERTLATKNVAGDRETPYDSGSRCLLKGKIESAFMERNRIMVVGVPQLDLLGDLAYAREEAINVQATAPDHSNMPDAVRALAYADGQDVSLGPIAKRASKYAQSALNKPRRNNAA
jgi:hypothetical protein